MLNITRNIYQHLDAWKHKSQRKPLMLRGARQVGKTFIIKKLGETFTNFIEINFLENKNLHKIFEKDHFDIEGILSDISGYFSKPIIDQETLIFFDEIQVCPAAIEALRFFYEKRPNLHIVAAGSLLEFVLSEIPSFGVGRVENLFMHPLTFYEFLTAQNKLGLIENIKKSTIKNPISEVLHNLCIEEFKKFLLVGGMPEAVSKFISNNLSYSKAQETIEDIIIGYEDDFQKYRKRVPSDRLRETLRSSCLQAGKKFIYGHAYLDARSQSVHEALNLLVMSGIVTKIHHSDGNGVPLGSETDLKKFKTLPLDTGIYQRFAGLKIQDLITINPEEFINKGALVETAIGLEIIANSSPKLRPELFYWHREAKSSNAELDYLIESNNQIIPIEVKSSKKGSMVSLRLFLKEKKKKLGVRLSFENFGFYDNILVLPVYAVSEIDRVVGEALT